MPYNRKAYAPFSQSAEAGITQAPVDGFIEVEQYIKPVIQAGTLGTDGKWLISPQSDTEFFVSDKAEGIPNSGEVLFPNTADKDFIDMTGFEDLILAFKPTTNAGTINMKGVMGPDTRTYANLGPVNSAVTLRSAGNISESGAKVFENSLDDSEYLTADVWNIFYVQGRLRNQKNLQIKMTNTDLGNTNFDFAYLRVVV